MADINQTIHDRPPRKETTSGNEEMDKSTSWSRPDSREDLRTLLAKKRALSMSSADESPVGGAKKRVKIDRNKTKQKCYAHNGTNTSRREPSLQRARLFVGNVEPNAVGRSDLIELFSKYGDVLGVSIHNGFAFVQMDREESANRGINYVDNHFFKGSRLDVEFCQAALKAGAKFKRLLVSPPKMGRPHDYSMSSSFHIRDKEEQVREKQERQQEAHLARILQMEREIAKLRSNQIGSGPLVDDQQRSHPPPCHPYHGQQGQERVHLHTPSMQIVSGVELADGQWRPSYPSSYYQDYYNQQEQVHHHPSLSPTVCDSNRLHREPTYWTRYEGEGGERPLLQVFLSPQM